MVREVDAAMDAGAHRAVDRARSTRRGCTRRRRGRGARRGDCAPRRAVRHAHAQRVRRACSRRSTRPSRPPGAAGTGARLQVSHLKCGCPRRLGPGRRGRRRPRARRVPTASTWRRTSTRTPRPPRRSRRSCRRPCSVLGGRRVRRRPRRPGGPVPRPRRDRAWELGLGERRVRPGLGRHPDRVCREPPGLVRSVPRASSAGRSAPDPADLAFDALIDDRLDVSVVIDCMTEPDVETIMAVPWIAVCTDAEGRRPGHAILDAGRAASTHLREHGPGPGHVRPRARRARRSRPPWRS